VAQFGRIVAAIARGKSVAYSYFLEKPSKPGRKKTTETASALPPNGSAQSDVGVSHLISSLKVPGTFRLDIRWLTPLEGEWESRSRQ